jgi:outer membrane murein-binding lipoprotein Lpp
LWRASAGANRVDDVASDLAAAEAQVAFLESDLAATTSEVAALETSFLQPGRRISNRSDGRSPI